jgi:hypothetical protein
VPNQAGKTGRPFCTLERKQSPCRWRVRPQWHPKSAATRSVVGASSKPPVRRFPFAGHSIEYATAVKIDAMTAMGEFLKQTEKQAGARGKPGPGRGHKNGVPERNPVSQPPTLADAGISKRESSDAQRLADLIARAAGGNRFV